MNLAKQTDEPLDRAEGAAGSFSYPTACRAQEER